MQRFNPSYVGPREDVLRLVPREARSVLDVGCSVGTLGQAIRQRTGARVTGLELDREMARLAEEKLDRVLTCNVEQCDLMATLGEERFDCIVFADILEHLRDPWDCLSRLAAFLAPDGVIVASIPNVRHYTTLGSLALAGRWPYRDRGIHDRTHLRFFTLRNIRDLFDGAGLRIRAVHRNYRIIEAPHRLNRIAPGLALPGLREFLAFQYLVVAGRASRA